MSHDRAYEISDYMNARNKQFRDFMAAAMASGDIPITAFDNHVRRAEWCREAARAMMDQADKEASE